MTTSEAASMRHLLLLLLVILGFTLPANLQAQAPVASFTVSASTGCSPFNVQFTNTSVNASGYYWVFGNGNTSTQTNPNNVFTNSGTYTVTLTATGPGGSTSTTQQITVVPTPTSNFSASAVVTCEDYGLIQFQNTSAGYDSSLWDFGDGTTSSLTSPSHQFANPGVYNIKLRVFNKQYGCSDIKVISNYITVNPRPHMSVTADTLRTCNLNHNFTFTPSGTGATTWLWKFGDGNTSSQQSAQTHTYTAAGNYIVNLITTNTNGCVDTFRLDTVKVLSNPVPAATISGTQGCAPYNVSLLSGAPSAQSYSWQLDTGSATTSTAYITYQAGVHHPQLTVIYPNGCSQHVVMPVVTVDSSPVGAFIMQNYAGCAPLTVNFLNQSSTGNYQYLWDFGDGSTDTNFVTTHVYDTVGYFVPSLTVTSSSGCKFIARNGYYYVNVNGPTAEFHPDVTSGCNPLTVNFTNTSVAATQYIWNFGDGDTSTAQHPTHVYTANGAYTVQLIAINSQGCRDTFVYQSQINVSNFPVTFVPPQPVTGCSPYTANFSDGTAASSWLWDFGDGTQATIHNPAHTFTTPGTYHVSLTVQLANGGCSYTIPDIQTFIIDGASPGFTYTVSPCPPYIVQFTDTSINAVAWHWTFGDGTISNVQNPLHNYVYPGHFAVNLEVTTPGGCVTSYSSLTGVTFNGLGAIATAFSSDTVPPLDVQFYANSTQATSWLWDFGDGTTSTLQNPLHTYTSTGPFAISLTIANDSCTITYPYPPIDFGSGGTSGILNPGLPDTILPLQYHCAPFTMNFYNPDPAATAWLWDFGDGVTSTLASPTHIYSDSGLFIPSLIYTSGGVTDTIVYSDTIAVSAPPNDFTIATQNSCNGIIVNASCGNPNTTNTWNFGNGSTAQGMSVSHIYPNASGSYSIIMNSSDAHGCSAYIAKSFTLIFGSSVSSSKRRACAGDTIAFSSGNLNYVAYAWDFGDGTTGSGLSPSHVYADSGLFTVTLYGTDINNCVSTHIMPYQVQVFNPQPSFSIIGPQTNCAYVYIQTDNTSTGSTSYYWTFGDGSSATTFEPDHYYSTHGTYSITLTASQNICSKSVTLNNAVAFPVLTPDFNSAVSSNCLPATAQFTDLSLNAVSWFWDFGDGDTSVLQNPVHIFTTVPHGPVTLRVKDVNGCTKTISRNVINATAASFTASLPGGCSGVTINFTDSSANAVSWLWNFGDGTYSSTQNPSHTYNQDGNYLVSLTVTAPDGCTSTMVADSAVVIMTSSALFQSDTQDGCTPLIVNFTNASEGAESWEWNFGDGSSSTLEFPSHLYTSPGVYTVTLVSSNHFGCSDTLIFTDYITVRGTIPYFTVSDYGGCAPLPVQFSDSSVNAVSLEWHFGDGTSITGMDPMHIYSDTGQYIASLFATDSTGCVSVYTLPDPIVIDAMPVAAATGNVTDGCVPVSISLDGSPSFADSLVWQYGDGSFSTGAIANHTYSVPGTYPLKLIAYNSNGCMDTLDLGSVQVYAIPVVNFSVSTNTGCMPLPVQFSSTSTLTNQPQYLWNFGNGDTSNSQNPVYVYPAAGTYTVTLMVTNAGGCASQLVIDSIVTVYDTAAPSPVNLADVSVASESAVDITWPVSNDNDIAAYKIYRLNPATSVFNQIAVVTQQSAVVVNGFISYKDQLLNTKQSGYTYKVQAVDLCGSEISIDSIQSHTTMLAIATAGKMKVQLNWTPYNGCSVSGYEIYRREQSSSVESLIGNVSSADTSYLDTTAYCPVNYTYRIKALNVCSDQRFASWSNDTSALPFSDVTEQKVVLTRTTVVNNSYTLTEWSQPELYPWLVSRYLIFRSCDSISYTLIASVPAELLQYEDHSAHVNAERYFYKVAVENICGTAGIPGGPGTSILLKAVQANSKYRFQWTEYREWENGVDHYTLEKLNDAGNWVPVRQLNSAAREAEED